MDAEGKRLARTRDQALSGVEPRGVRPAVRASWDRSRSNGVRPDRYLPPVPLAEDAVFELRREHPLARVWPTLERTLRTSLDGPGRILFLSDAAGHLLWVDGDRTTMRRAEQVNLVPGARWSEDAAGTSGVGTTLALGRPFQVRGPEHYLSAATRYTCSAAPIRDTMTGAVLGALDLTTEPLDGAEGLALSLVVSTARLAEAQLREYAHRQHAELQRRYVSRLANRVGSHSAVVTPDGRVVFADPVGWLPDRWYQPLREGTAVLPDGRSVVIERLAVNGPFFVMAQEVEIDAAVVFGGLGLDRGWLRVDGVAHELTMRHSELLSILCAWPGGLTAEGLAREVYGPQGKTVTVRAEMARLRRILGYRLASEPYRLVGPVRADFLDLEQDLASGSVGGLLDRYRGPLLPRSAAPGVVELRARVHERLRGRVFSEGDTDSVVRWLAAPHSRPDRLP
ncbi:GAF domain-containing protein [Allokutzneria sp. A3M-2-11 16]|uniref:GAF domain-containing protein n=1 Tax=Allokutzneria sp. A3M-2-11 16 TaxID=2962043 RepID=UPI0020B72C11|nr:GAF domain-containing protein [Allokutzneria sp. A3M-2-11 16]MCP3804421.1 GAF domain-containing protein [Allokutzneria sp. A3M-2-11 16]